MAEDKRRCSQCGQAGHDRRSCGRLDNGKPFDPWADLEWEEHVEARRVVWEHPDGMTLEEVGDVLGVTRERVRQIEWGALEKLRTGSGDQVVVVDGVALAVVKCARCGAWVARRGRRKICGTCATPPPVGSYRRRKPGVEPIGGAPEVEGVDVAVLGELNEGNGAAPSPSWAVSWFGDKWAD